MILVLAETNFNHYDDSTIHQPDQCCLGIFRNIDDAEIAKQHYAEKVCSCLHGDMRKTSIKMK